MLLIELWMRLCVQQKNEHTLAAKTHNQQVFNFTT